MIRKAMSHLKPAVLALGVSLLVAGCQPPVARNTPQSIATERARAVDLVQQLRAQDALVEDAGLNAYIGSIVQRINAVRGRGAVPVRPFIIKDGDINAFTPGGGYLFVNAGLIAAMENEAQLAMVLAHEIGHIDRGHIQAQRGQRASVGLGAAAATLGGALLGIDPQLTGLGVRLGSTYAMSSFTREQERDADVTGGRYLAAAGYNLLAAANSFDVLRRISGGPGGGLMASHPPTNERQQTMIRLAHKLGATSGRVGERQYDRETRELREKALAYYQNTGRRRAAAIVSANLTR